MDAIFFLSVVAVAFASFLVGISIWFGPKGSSAGGKMDSYECGLSPKEKNQTYSIPVKFYRTAILFIIFDIEIIFIYPFALHYREFLSQSQGPVVLLGMILFLSLFLLGLWWEIRSNALKWD